MLLNKIFEGYKRKENKAKFFYYFKIKFFSLNKMITLSVFEKLDQNFVSYVYLKYLENYRPLIKNETTGSVRIEITYRNIVGYYNWEITDSSQQIEIDKLFSVFKDFKHFKASILTPLKIEFNVELESRL